MRRTTTLYRRFQHFESRLAGVLGISVGCVLLTSCATTLRIQTDFLPEGSLRLAEVTYVATQKEIVQSKDLYDALVSSGIKDSEIKDGSVALARVFCCGNPMAGEQERMLYAPQQIGVMKGDIVEVKSGRSPVKGDSGRLNTVMRVRQKGGEGATSCNWIPPDPSLWARILYCDWMPSEGWIEQGGMNKAWFKPAAKP